MRKRQKKIAEEYVRLLGQAHDGIRKAMEYQDLATALDLLEQSQGAAIQLGTLIEEAEGEGFVTVGMLEEYCEFLFQVYTLLTQGQAMDPGKVRKQLKKRLIQVENSIRRDTTQRLEAVFLPYKASMWDSMESVWMAAEADEGCDAYVIPIPYYDRNPDGSVKAEHYEGDQYPAYVPVTSYKEFDFEEHEPDMVFIHNPYDGNNYVTSVHPFFYSSNLKRYTKELVYIPYYTTAGGMSDVLSQCPAYYHVDHIIIQAEKYRKFFDPALPPEKLVALGSPKFDRVIRMCEDPPEAPEAWKRMMEGEAGQKRRVFFYNTSIHGMLGDTKGFLEKMEYVFRCFEGRKDVCLLWRPHPLLESTFASMRSEYKPVYDALKKYFLETGLGIYDDTPDITVSIALSDVYIGDSATSVTSLFGLAGKPLFILNNHISSGPEEDDWRGAIVRGIPAYEPDRERAWMVTQGNKLYRSLGREEPFRFFCDLSEYSYGNYYLQIAFLNGKKYICPINAQDILVVGEEGIERRIPLKRCVEQSGVFYSAAVVGKYLFLLPDHYPYLVRYDVSKDEIRYLEGNVDLHADMVNGERRCGGVCIQGGRLYLASPVDRRILEVDAATGEQRVLEVGAVTEGRRETRADAAAGGQSGAATDAAAAGQETGGWMAMVALPNGTEIWLLPFEGNVITRWNPHTGQVWEYRNCPEGFHCTHAAHGYRCMERPFSGAAFHGNKVYFSPCWGNMYLCLDKDTGEMTQWKPPIQEPEQPKKGYYPHWSKGILTSQPDLKTGEPVEDLLFSYYDSRMYHVDFHKDECREIRIEFDPEELRRQEPGFREESQWLQYICGENAFNSLPDHLDGKVTGSAFDRDRQIRAFGQIAANHDGSSGEKIYGFAKARSRE